MLQLLMDCFIACGIFNTSFNFTSSEKNLDFVTYFAIFIYFLVVYEISTCLIKCNINNHR